MVMPAPAPILPDQTRRDWTVEELHALPDDGNRYEVVDGELLVTPAPSLVHQRTVLELAVLLRAFLSADALECIIAPANVLLGPVAITVLLARWFAEMRGRAVGIAIAGISAGVFLFPMIIQSLLDHHSWREALRFLGLVLLVWTVPAALLAIDRPADRGLFPDGASAPPPQAAAETAKAPMSALQILSDPAFWMIAGTVSIVTAGMKGMITNLAPLALDNGITPQQAATLVSIYAAASFTAKLSFAALADRLGPRTLMFVALGGFALGMATLTQASLGFGIVAMGVATIGILGGFMVPIESYIAPRVFGQNGVGRAMGLLSGAILGVLLCTPPLFGFIFDVTGSYNGIFWTFAGLAVAALFWTPAIRLHAREPRLAPAAAE